MGRSVPITPPRAALSDGAVAVRLRRASDLAAIAAASRDPQTRRWLDDEPMDEEALRTGLARVEAAWRAGTAAPMVIAGAAADEPLGIVNLQFRSDHLAALAYSVFPAHRGRGIAPRAVLLVTAWALTELRLTTVRLEADLANTASLRVAEKCGFRRLGTRTAPADPPAPLRTTAIFARSAE